VLPHASVPLVVDGWSTSDRRRDDGAVESVQRARVAGPVVEDTEDGARRLGDAYLRAVAWGPVRVRRHEVRLLGLPPALLAFESPELAVDAERIQCIYRIRGGLLARKPGGTLVLSQADGGLTVAVEGFFPRLAVLHHAVQSRIHAAVSRRYFRMLLAGAPR
jgi:hypothetical protein